MHFTVQLSIPHRQLPHVATSTATFPLPKAAPRPRSQHTPRDNDTCTLTTCRCQHHTTHPDLCPYSSRYPQPKILLTATGRVCAKPTAGPLNLNLLLPCTCFPYLITRS
ncbi:hypothetical protein CI102_12724 [Trichoderma harzianum]|nr:hypothetical protein CI102_12724 [Trichoderma harzianum]